MKFTNKKKIWLINRDFQFKYSGAGIVAGLVSTIITGTFIIYPLYEFKILTVGMFLPWPILLCILGSVILNSLVQLIFGIVLTHKIAGPMFSLVKHIRMLGAGRWNIKMKQRPGDELQMIVRHFNEMSEHIVKTVDEDMKLLDKIKYSVTNFTGEIGERDFLLANIETLSIQMKQRVRKTTND